MSTLPDGAASIFVDCTRVTKLAADGSCPPGSPVFITDTLLKATLTPVMETGDDLVTKGANGNILVRYKHGDMLKYYTVALDYSTPDNGLEQALTGGVILNDTSTGIVTLPTLTSATVASTGGTLPAAGSGAYAYRITALNLYGESLPSTEVATTAAATGSTSSVTLAWPAVTAATAGYNIYGRTPGGELLIGHVGAGVTTFVDTGAVLPAGALPVVNTTPGPGPVGYQAPPLGVVGNPTGVSLEFWSKAVVSGSAAATLPYWRYVLPQCRNFRDDARTLDNTVAANMYTGEAFDNISNTWGTGPFGDWPFDASQVWQRARVSRASVPFPAVDSVATSTATV